MKLESGVSVTSKPFSTTGMGAEVDIFHGEGYGFIIEPVGTAIPHSSIIKVNLRGRDNVANDNMWVKPSTWYWTPFSALKVVQNDELAPGEMDQGDWVCNIGIQPYMHVQPSNGNPDLAAFPAESGGFPTLTQKLSLLRGLDEANDPAVVPPTASNFGIGFGEDTTSSNTGSPQVPSVYGAFVSAPVNNVITGGSLDIWRYNANGLGWHLMSNVQLPVGARRVGIPADSFGTREMDDRFAVTTNGITLDNGGTSVTIIERVQ